MSVNRFFQKDTFVPESAGSSDCGTVLKEIAERFAEKCPEGIITNTEVITNTASNYSVRYQLWNKPIYLQIYNSSSAVYIGVYELIDGSYKTIVSDSQSNMLSITSTNTINIFTVGIEDFALGVTIQSGLSYSVYACALWGNDMLSNTDAFFGIASSSTNVSIGGYVGCLNLAGSVYKFVETANRGVVIYPTGLDSYSVYLGYNLGYTYSYYRIGQYYVTTDSTSKWIGQIKWGGKYDLYVLYKDRNVMTGSPGDKYTIDGETHTAVSTCLYKFVENV